MSPLRVKIIAKTASWLCQEATELMADLCRQGQLGIGDSPPDLPEVFPAHATLTRHTIFREARCLAKLLQAPRPPLADAFGVVVGVVVAIRGHDESSPEFVEHELLLSGTQWRARNGVPGGVDVLPCPALGDESSHFHAFDFTRDAWKQGERGSGFVGEMTTDGLFDCWIIRACLLMQTGLRGWMRGHVNGLQTAIAVGPVFAGWR